MQPALPSDENARLEALWCYSVLDTPPEPEFDDLAHLAAQICQAPIASVNLIDERRQWFKSSVGLEMPEVPRDISFGTHTIVGHELLIIPDTLTDERFADSPLVTGPPHIRFYAGVPIVTPEGYALGTMCVADTVPREIDASQQDALRRLARQAVALLEARPETPSDKKESRQARIQSESNQRALAADLARQESLAILKESEIRYRRLFEAAKDGILIMDADSGQIDDVNPGLCDLLGYPRGFFVGKQLWELDIFKEIVPNREALLQLKANGFVAINDLSLQTFGGQTVSVEFVSSIYHVDGKEVIQRNIRDVTERKRMKERLQHERDFTSAVIDTAGSLVVVLDREGHIIRFNQACEKLTGYSFAEVKGRNFTDCLLPANAVEGVKSTLQYLVSGQFPNTYENEWVSKDGNHYLIAWSNTALLDSQGVVEYVIASGIDVTERRREEEQLRLLQTCVSRLNDIVFITEAEPIDEPGPRILFVNEAFEKRTGFTQSEVLGRTPRILQGPKTQRDALDRIRSAMEQWQPVREEVINYTKDGNELWLEMDIVPVANASGWFTHWVAIERDITERKQTEEALRQSRDELELRITKRTKELAMANEALRVENIEHQMTLGALRVFSEALEVAKNEADAANAAKSEFLSRMSHELRTPLNAILGFGQILDRQELTPLQKESVNFILKGGHHLLRLINEVLDIARVEAGRVEISIEPVGLSDVVVEACSMMQPLAAERDITLVQNTVPIGAAHVLADRQRLKQVLINLLSNAIKYNRVGGQVEVSCHSEPTGQIQVCVRDTGQGITPENLPKLFVPFERLGVSDSEIEGTGLGLLLSKRLMEGMGGTLDVESVVGQGCTFFFQLPQSAAPVDLVANALELVDDAAKVQKGEGTYSVLCIEDNVSNLRLIDVILGRRSEITLFSAMEGAEGLNLARLHNPDLILLDLNLPDMHGKEVLTRLKQSALTQDIPVIVISADATQKQIERLQQLGVNAYLPKPLDVQQFLHTVDEILDL